MLERPSEESEVVPVADRVPVAAMLLKVALPDTPTVPMEERLPFESMVRLPEFTFMLERPSEASEVAPETESVPPAAIFWALERLPRT
jgi:hypothetical protein